MGMKWAGGVRTSPARGNSLYGGTAMATVASPRSSAKPRRTIRLALPPTEINPVYGVVIRVAKATDT